MSLSHVLVCCLLFVHYNAAPGRTGLGDLGKTLEGVSDQRLRSAATSSSTPLVTMALSSQQDTPSFGSNRSDFIPVEDGYDNDLDDIDYDSLQTNAPYKLVTPAEPLDEDDAESASSEESLSRLHKEAIVIRLEQVRESILSKLRLSMPPTVNVTAVSEHRFPKHLIGSDLMVQDPDMQMDSRMPEDTYHAKIKNIIQFASPVPTEKMKEVISLPATVYFMLPQEVSERNVEKAMLLVYILTPDGAAGRNATLLIKSNQRRKKFIAMRNIDLLHGGHWEHIDITDEVKYWAANETGQNAGLWINAKFNGKNIAVMNGDSQQLAGKDRIPLIKFTLNGKEEGRYRRSTDDISLSCHPDDREKRCCKYKFVIDFDELGPDFNFIITPRRYLANYCAGTCEAFHLPSNINSHLMKGFTRRKLERCCTATEHAPMDMLYLTDSNTIHQGTLPGMTINKCGCS